MSEDAPHEFTYTLPPGWWWEVVHLTFGRGRVQATDGVNVGDFW